MLTIEEISRMLSDRRLGVVSEATGLHYNTIRAIRDGTSKKPSHDTIKALSDYFTTPSK